MPTFTPPVVADIPPVEVHTKGIAARLFRYFPNRERYVSVFMLSDGTFVQDTATEENQNTSVPYPWDPNNPGGAYASVSYYDYDLGVFVIDDIAHSVWIVKLYGYGPQEVSTSEAAALANAGYGDCLS